LGCTASPLFGANGSGGFVFNFLPVIPVGGQSDYLIVYTDQTTINPGLASLHDTSETGVAADLATATAPEPGSLALVGTGLIALAGLLRRKFLQA
jgi:threonine dehydrogenase-like Zn-dependent dehydrogenase